jgi:hypothetical protein
VLGFLMFAVLWRLRGHKHAEGWLFGCTACSPARALRDRVLPRKDDRFYGPFTAAQVIAIAIGLAGRGVDVHAPSHRPGGAGDLRARGGGGVTGGG